jgi:hypothetical protein
VLQVCDAFAIRLARRRPRFNAVHTYRNAAAALAAGAACLSLAACSAGITTASTATTAATNSASPSRSATATAPPSAAGRMLQVSGVPGGFPVPAGAKVAENVSTTSGIGVMFSKVTPAKAQTFYTQALPRAGYRITSAQSFSGIMIMQFTGHGYKGTVSTMANADPKDTLPGLGTKNVTTILMQAK